MSVCVALGVSAFAGARSAHACSCASVIVNQLMVGNGKIASNLGGVAWWNNYHSETDQFALERWNGSDFDSVPARLDPGPNGNVSIIGPEQPWVAGERYRIAVTTAGAGSQNRGGTTDVIEIEIVDAIDTTVPLELSVTAPPMVGQVVVGPGGSACGGSLQAASVQVTLPEPLDAYASLFFTTRVDGQAYLPPLSLCSEQEPGASWQQTHGSDLIAAACGLTNDAPPYVSAVMPLLPEGTHTVVLEAALPDTSLVWRSNEVTVDLRCPTVAEPAAMAAAVSAPPAVADATASVHTQERGCTLGSGVPRRSQTWAWAPLIATSIAFWARRLRQPRPVRTA